MAITSVLCHVSHGHVTLVSDLEGGITRVICPDLDASHTCRLKKRASANGPLAQLLERVSEATLDSKTMRCEMV